jgi:acyl carrier protein
VDIRTQLLSFIRAELAKNAPDVDLEADSLVETGIIDSVAILKLVSFIEKSFKVKIGDDELLPENFDTLDDVTRLVATKAT